MEHTEQVQADEFERVLSGDSARARDSAAEFTPLIELAREAIELLAPPTPSQAFSSRARTRLLHRLTRPADSVARREQRSAHKPRLQWRPAFIGLIMIVALLGGSLGAAYAADDALPGEALYPAKRGLEQLQLALTGTPGNRASLRAHFASERLEEAEALMAAGREMEANGLLNEYQNELAEMIGLAQQSPETAGFVGLQQALEVQQRALQRFLERSSEAGDVAVGKAIEEARHSQEVLETLLQGANPSDLAPGQLRRTEIPEAESGQGQGQGQGHGAGRWQHTPSP